MKKHGSIILILCLAVLIPLSNAVETHLTIASPLWQSFGWLWLCGMAFGALLFFVAGGRPRFRPDPVSLVCAALSAAMLIVPPFLKFETYQITSDLMAAILRISTGFLLMKGLFHSERT